MSCPGSYTLMPQSEVTKRPDVEARAVALLKAWRAGGFPVGATHSEELTADGVPVDYRFEWHPPDFQNEKLHSGITVFWCPAGKGATPPLAPAPTSAPTSPSPQPPSGSSGEESSSPDGSSSPDDVCVLGGADDVEGSGDAGDSG